MRVQLAFVMGLALLASACGTHDPTGPELPAGTELTFNVVTDPSPVPGAGLRSSTTMIVELGRTSGAAWTITKATFVVRDARSQGLLKATVSGPIAIPADGVGVIRSRLAWEPADEVGRRVDIAVSLVDAAGARTEVLRSLTF